MAVSTGLLPVAGLCLPLDSERHLLPQSQDWGLTVARLGNGSLSVPGKEHWEDAPIILCGRIPKPVGDKHSGIVSVSESCFPYVGGIPDLRILHPDFHRFLFSN